MRRTGIVKTFKDRWGFIRPSGSGGGGEDLFFYAGSRSTFQPGDEVSYLESEDRKHPGRSCAVDVAPLEREVA
jgi:cold shock CspA family protein